MQATSQFWGADGPLVRRRSGGRWRTGTGTLMLVGDPAQRNELEPRLKEALAGRS